MKISDILNQDVIEINIDVSDKVDAINKIISIAARTNNILDIKKVTDTILEREKHASTGMGNGFAIPYLRTNHVRDIAAAFITTKEPIDFESNDAGPVKYILILLGKKADTNILIGLLSGVSHLFNQEDFRKKLLGASSKEEILNIFIEWDKKF